MPGDAGADSSERCGTAEAEVPFRTARTGLDTEFGGQVGVRQETICSTLNIRKGQLTVAGNHKPVLKQGGHRRSCPNVNMPFFPLCIQVTLAQLTEQNWLDTVLISQ